MNIRKFLVVLLLGVSTMTLSAQTTRSQVESGIQSVERLIAGHQWQEAFAKLREVEGSASGSPTLKYLTMKERYSMYQRINRGTEAKNCMTQMESLAMQSGDNNTIEDMLLSKAAYYNRIGNPKVSKDCYLTILNRRSKGADDKGMEACFKKLIAEASSSGNHQMKATISEIYGSWQDSIAAIKASKELNELKANYEAAQTDISDKQTKINVQWGTIIFLAVLLIGVAAALVFFILVMVRNRITIKKLQHSLEVSEESSAQKSVFMRNITNQIAPSLHQISTGNKAHIDALGALLKDVEKYMELEGSKQEKYETSETNVGKLCEDIIQACAERSMTITTTEAPKITFPVNKEAVMEILMEIISQTFILSQPEKVQIAFKKRNPHTGQFTVTAVGMKLSDEEKSILFTAFAKVYDLTKTTGLILPTCALQAYKMGGTLSIDDTFAKGTRFVLEVHC